jgi:hypothetical protein
MTHNEKLTKAIEFIAFDQELREAGYDGIGAFLGESACLAKFGGDKAPKGTKAYDIVTPDGRRNQVKTKMGKVYVDGNKHYAEIDPEHIVKNLVDDVTIVLVKGKDFEIYRAPLTKLKGRSHVSGKVRFYLDEIKANAF